MTTDFKYTSAAQDVVVRTNDDGSMFSCFVDHPEVQDFIKAGGTIQPADVIAADTTPDPASALAALLISKGVIKSTDLHPDVLADINADLVDSGQAAIAIQEV